MWFFNLRSLNKSRELVLISGWGSCLIKISNMCGMFIYFNIMFCCFCFIVLSCVIFGIFIVYFEGWFVWVSIVISWLVGKFSLCCYKFLCGICSNWVISIWRFLWCKCCCMYCLYFFDCGLWVIFYFSNINLYFIVNSIVCIIGVMLIFVVRRVCILFFYCGMCLFMNMYFGIMCF